MGTIIAIIIAYLLGSVTSSIILTRIKKLPDPRTQGSGNAGATRSSVCHRGSLER